MCSRQHARFTVDMAAMLILTVADDHALTGTVRSSILKQQRLKFCLVWHSRSPTKLFEYHVKQQENLSNSIEHCFINVELNILVRHRS